MSTQPLWTLQEASILLDEFLKARKGQCTRKQAIANASKKLRQMAVNNGQEIDDIYRNENGITFQMSSLESAYLGKTVLKPPTRLFTEIVSLYRTDYSKYKSILEEAQSQAAENISVELPATPNNDRSGTGTVQKEFKNTNQTEQRTGLVFDPIVETIQTALRNESATNSAGTTITYLQTKVVPIVGVLRQAEIKKILDDAPWAKFRYGKWHYVDSNASIVGIPKSTNSTAKNSQKKPAPVIMNTSSRYVPPLNNTAPTFLLKNDTESKFANWLSTCSGYEGSINAYLAGLHTAEVFAENHHFKYRKLLDATTQTAIDTANELINDLSFANYSLDRGNYPMKAVKKYFAFLQSSFGVQVSGKSVCANDENVFTSNEKNSSVAKSSDWAKLSSAKKERFIDWLLSKNNASKAMCDCYIAGFKSAIRFAEKNNYNHNMLYSDDFLQVKAISDKLLHDAKFNMFSVEQEHYPRKAIEEYIAFLGKYYGIKQPTLSFTTPTNIFTLPNAANHSVQNSSTGKSLKDMFAEYLMKKYSDITVSEMFTGLAEADEFLTSFKIVSDTIFSISDIRLLTIAHESIQHDKTFRAKHKSQMHTIKNAFMEYSIFFKSLPKEIVNEAVSNGKKASITNIVSDPMDSTPCHITEENASAVEHKFHSEYRTNPPISSASERISTSEKTTHEVYPGSSDNYAFSKPISYSYFGERQAVTSWKDLFVKVCSTLNEDYPEVFDDMMGTSLINGSRYEIGNAYHSFKMTVPKLFSPGKYVETNLSATDIMHRIKILLDKCAVDYENLAITIIQHKNSSDHKDNMQANTDNNSDLNTAVKEERAHFIAWMQNRGRQSATIFSYLSAIKKISELCNEKGLITTDILLVTNSDALNGIQEQLSFSQEFKQWNLEQHNRFSTALNALINFRAEAISEKTQSTSGDATCQYTKLAVSNEEICSTQEASNYSAVLRTHFEDGFRPEKAIDRNRFTMYYAEMFGVDPPDSGDKLVRILSKIGTLRDDRIFVKDNENQKDLIDEIISTAMETFQKGASCICVECLYNRYSSELAATLHIYNEIALEETILKRTKGTLKKRYTYLHLSQRNPDPAKDVKEYLVASSHPVSYTELEEKLWYIKLDKIKQTLVATPSMVNVDSEKYLYAPKLPVSESEVHQITALIHNALLQRNFISDAELIGIIEENCPSVIMNTSDYPTWGLRNALACLLRDEFSFRGPIISSKGAEISMAEVFSDFCQRLEQVTVEELRAFANEMKSVIYWESVYSEMVRISQREFIRRNRIHFDIEQIDSVLDKLIPDAYVPIKNINLFLLFPAIDIPWNSYVLESFIANYSKKFRLLHIGYASTDCCGAIVRQESNIFDYRELIVDVLSQDHNWTTEETALQLLVDQGYQQRKTYRDIEVVMQEARSRMRTSKK